MALKVDTRRILAESLENLLEKRELIPWKMDVPFILPMHV